MFIVMVLNFLLFLKLGTWVGIGFYTMHHDPLVWNDPEVKLTYNTVVNMYHKMYVCTYIHNHLHIYYVI